VPYGTEEEVEAYKASCQMTTFQYNDLLRYVDNFKGNDYWMSVKVAQVMDDGSIRAIFDEDYNDIVIRDMRTYDTVKILADDEITVYAKYVGTVTMTRALTETEEEIPCFEMYAADIAGVTDTEYYGTDMNNLDYVELYGDIISECEGGAYTLYDLNDDGRLELLLEYEPGNPESYNSIYVINELGAVSDTDVFQGDFMYYVAEDGDGLYGVSGHAGSEHVYRVSMVDGGGIDLTELWYNEEVEDYYSNDNYVETCDTSDMSLLENEK
jgi:hypothetical protein